MYTWENVKMRIREIWIIILGLKQAVVKKLLHVSSGSTFGAVLLILLIFTIILKNFLGSNIKV